jgi:glycosyltransferase involved in cell wall biosynthesis
VNGTPLEVRGQVIRLAPEEKPELATVRVGETDIGLAADRRGFRSFESFESAGVDPLDYRIVLVKHGCLFPELRERAPRALIAISPGFAELVEAFAMVHEGMPDTQLVIVGSGPEGPRLTTLASQLGVDRCVRFVGRVQHDALLSLYDEADVFCLASEDEGFGIVYLEAMARGVPVIGSAGEGIADIVVSEENGILVPPRDAAAIAAAVRRLLTDDSLLRRLGEAGKDTVSTRLTWGKNARSHLDLYQRVLGISA